MMDGALAKSVAAVVPVFNPEPGLRGLIASLCNRFAVVLIVDDGSDECREDFEELDSRSIIIRHECNKGKGRAIKTAFKWLIDNRPDVNVAVFVDGDGQHRVEDAVAVAEHALLMDRVTLGVRSFDKGVPVRSKFGNLCTGFLVRLIYKLKISDTQTGLRAYPSRIFSRMINISGERYEYEMRLFGVMRKFKEPIDQLPIKTIYIESNRASHFRPIRDSIRVYYGLFGGGFLKFIFSSIFGFVIDNLVFTVLIYIFQGQSVSRKFGILLSLAVARLVSASANYCCNRKFVFEANNGKVVSSVRYAILVVAVAVISYALTLITSEIVDAHGVLVTLLKIVIETIVFFLSYYVQKHWVFS